MIYIKSNQTKNSTHKHRTKILPFLPQKIVEIMHAQLTEAKKQKCNLYHLFRTSNLHLQI